VADFEAGALAKAVESSRVVPLAIDLKPSDIELPLGQFQAQAATEDGISEVLTSINAACDSPLDAPLLGKAVKKWWPDLEAGLDQIERNAAASPEESVARTDRELIEETLNTVRSLARRRSTDDDDPLDARESSFVDELVELLRREAGSPYRIAFEGSSATVSLSTPLSASLEAVAKRRAKESGFRLDFALPDDVPSQSP
jgi:hypothetical protein